MKKDLIIKNRNNDKITLNYNDLDFGLGIGDYFYNGNCNGSQLGFCWDEELGQEYIDFIYLNVYEGNEKENDLYSLDTKLYNNVSEKNTILLSNIDYKKFVDWLETTGIKEFHYYSPKDIEILEEYNGVKFTINHDLLDNKDLDFFHYGCRYTLGYFDYGIIEIVSRGELKCRYIKDDINTDNYFDIIRYHVRNNDEYKKAVEDENLILNLNNWFEIEIYDKDCNYVTNLYDDIFGSISDCIETLKNDLDRTNIKDMLKDYFDE